MEVEILQVPYDSGLRGQRMGGGPLRLVESGIMDRISAGGHRTRLCTIELPEGQIGEVGAALQAAQRIRDRVMECARHDYFPLVLSGNCISSLGTISALPHLDVFWFDAHGDLNTPETTRSGFIDGMALSILLGRCWTGMSREIGLVPLSEDAVWLMGARDLDPPEEEFLRHSRVHWVRSADEFLPKKSAREAYVHIDLDVLDPSVGRANSFFAPGGWSLDQVLGCIEIISRRRTIRAAAITAYDPSVDPNGTMLEPAFQIGSRVVAAVS